VGLDIVGCDVVEVYPAYDPAGITALLAANVAHEFLSLIALSRKGAALKARSAP
jgi:agmatinase